MVKSISVPENSTHFTRRLVHMPNLFNHSILTPNNADANILQAKTMLIIGFGIGILIVLVLLCLIVYAVINNRAVKIQAVGLLNVEIAAPENPINVQPEPDEADNNDDDEDDADDEEDLEDEET